MPRIIQVICLYVRVHSAVLVQHGWCQLSVIDGRSTVHLMLGMYDVKTKPNNELMLESLLI
jgi:hypothetical protein